MPMCVPEGAGLRCVLTETSGTTLFLVAISETGLPTLVYARLVSEMLLSGQVDC